MNPKVLLPIFILLTPFSQALQFSPSSLSFEISKEQTQCKTVYFQLDSPTTLQDVWASSANEEWSITNFQTSSKQHNLKLQYQKQLTNENQIQICISGTNEGEYKGALLFNQEKVGNSIIQFAVWLKVTIDISEDNQEQPDEQPEKKSENKRSSGSGSSDSVRYSYLSNSKEEPKTVELTDLTPEHPETITLNSPKEKTKLTSFEPPFSILLLLAFTIIATLIISAIILKR